MAKFADKSFVLPATGLRNVKIVFVKKFLVCLAIDFVMKNKFVWRQGICSSISRSIFFTAFLRVVVNHK